MNGINMDLPRPEYPRPDFERSLWMNLNGAWDFCFDDEDRGEKEGWYKKPVVFDKKITVPFCYQSEMSMVHDTNMHEIMWYRRTITLPEAFRGKRILLHFGAVDYEAKVWVNGQLVCVHRGGYVPFKVDITEFVKKKENILTVKVTDRFECVQPRGKQYWKEKPDRCWYIPTSGIWQTVWLEAVGEVFIDRVKFTPDIDRKDVKTEIYLDRFPYEADLEIEVSYKGKPVNRSVHRLKGRISAVTLDIREEDNIDEIHHWTPDRPNLYDVNLKLWKDGILLDEVKSYFGMRKISVQGDMILLNNRVYYQRLILDQGYWKESLLTPPSDEAIRKDIEYTKRMGFNGARKHQKIEDPRYYYWADKLGLLVWGEVPSAYDFNDEEVDNLLYETKEFIKRDYNHPCIVTWVPLNESWGVRNIYSDQRQQEFAIALYFTIRSLDQTRLISTNDGWEQIYGDICAVHDYMASGEGFLVKYEDRDAILSKSAGSRMIYCEGEEYDGQPVLITEYGGIAMETEEEGWGYNGKVKDEKEFLRRYESITKAIMNTPYIRGYCYTQLTDVFQEINGLLTMDRRFKVNPEEIRRINQNR
ncbi:MAG: glycoside hydrolase family 2 protein [Clostridia bacterium]|jgi:beta-galactosidase/beta-glucuronidase